MSPTKGKSLRSEPGFDLSYELVRSAGRKRTLTLQVKEDGRIVLLVPERISRAEADGFFRKKEAWIREKLKERREAPFPPRGGKEFRSGEEFLYHGEAYPLEIVETGSRQPLVLSRGRFVMRPDRQDKAREVFAGWYRERAREELTERVGHYAGRTGLMPTGLTISGASSRYGSCSAANRLSLSWRIIMAPYPVVDYVILHELAHIKEKNHSKRFWGFLESLLPEYRERRRWLREHTHLLRF
jgi:predicted metal-dependent hydrolase